MVFRLEGRAIDPFPISVLAAAPVEFGKISPAELSKKVETEEYQNVSGLVPLKIFFCVSVYL